MDTGTPGVSTEETRGTIAPEEINEVFERADLEAVVAQIASSVDRQRHALIMMWVAVLGLAGITAFIAVGLLRDRGIDIDA